jgi:hypothetical protein
MPRFFVERSDILTNQEIDHLVFMLRLQTVSAPTIFMSNHNMMKIIEALEHYMTKIKDGNNCECKKLIEILKVQNQFTPHVMLTEEQIQLVTSYLIVYKQMLSDIEEYKPNYSPKPEALFGKCILQIRQHLKNRLQHLRFYTNLL